MTSTELAKRLGVSQSTVSRALSGHPRVREATRNRILAEAKALGYEPNTTARSLRSGRVGALGLLFDADWKFGAKSWYLNRVLRDMALACSEADLNMSVRQVAIRPDGIDIGFHQNRVDGVLVAVRRHVDAIAEALERARLPYVLFRRRAVTVDAPYIDTQDDIGMLRLAQHLYHLGHRRIAYIGPETSVSARRVEGFRKALAAVGLAARDEWILEMDEPLQVVGNFFYDEPHPTAIVCYDDRRAMELIRWCQLHRIEVPGDLSVCGFGDEDPTEAFALALTTVRFPIMEMMREAVAALWEAVVTGGRPKLQKSVPVQLIERQSTAPPRRFKLTPPF